jgi:hypothetical protein
VDFLSYVNANYKYISPLDDFIGFHVIRDPRDILVSSYFSSLKTHSTANWPELENHRAELRAISKEEGLLLEMNFIADVFEALETWNFDDSRILEIKMEEIMQNNYIALCRVFAHLCILDEHDDSTSSLIVQTRNHIRLMINRMFLKTHGLSLVRSHPPKIPVLNFLGVVHRNRFEAKAKGRSAGAEDQSSHFRKGVAGDWRNHFDDKLKRVFKDRYGELILTLNYAESMDW